MCLLTLSVLPRSDSLGDGVLAIIASNRDEFHARPTREAHFWEEAPQVFAGKDLEKGGTWMGVTRTGRFAAITNFRHPLARKEGRSRGDLVRQYLSTSAAAEVFLAELAEACEQYPSFNLVVGDESGVWYFSDAVESGAPPRRQRITSGVHGLSNGRLDEPWPKVERLKAATEHAILEAPRVSDALFEALADRELAADETLPQTGVGLEIERFLSAPFLVSPRYGTRASTVLLVAKDGSIQMEERSFDTEGRQSSRALFAAAP